MNNPCPKTLSEVFLYDATGMLDLQKAIVKNKETPLLFRFNLNIFTVWMQEHSLSPAHDDRNGSFIILVKRNLGESGLELAERRSFVIRRYMELVLIKIKSGICFAILCLFGFCPLLCLAQQPKAQGVEIPAHESQGLSPEAEIETMKSNHSKGQIEGKILDASSKEPLIGVNVIILNTSCGAATNVQGKFLIERVPESEVTLVVSYMGYKSEQRTVSVKKDKTTVADFDLLVSIMETGVVVVTGTATPYLYQDAPVKTEVITQRLIRQTKACNLAEALDLQTGVRVENNCQNCNFTQVRILGFDGRYSQILIDGDPVVSTLAGVYALEHFPNEMIDQIEIVKGGGSALYGGGAVAGTINLRTRQPYSNRARVSFLGQSLDGAMDQKAGAMAELVSPNGSTGAYLYGSIRRRDPYDHNGDGFSELGEIKHESLGLNGYYRPFRKGEVLVRLDRIGEERRGGNDFGKPQHEADIAEWVNHSRWGGKLRWNHRLNRSMNYQVYYSFSFIDRDSYYGGLGGNTPADSLEAMNYYGHTKNRTHVAGMQTTFSLHSHSFTAGAQYSSDYLNDKSVNDPRYYIDETYTNSGLYFQDDFALFAEQLRIVAGARVDKHSALQGPVFSPRLNAKYDLARDVSLRAAFTTGFKAPQTFDEDLHIESLGGVQRVVRNAPNLKPERSRSVSGGLAYQGILGDMPLLIGVTAFFTRLEDAFVEVADGGQDTNLILWKRINSGGSANSGVEVDLGLRPFYSLELRGGLTYKKGVFDSEQEIFEGVYTNRFMRTPDLFGYFRASWDVSPSMNLFAALKYTGSMHVPNETAEVIVKTTETFLELDFGVDYFLPLPSVIDAKLTLGIKNLTNVYQQDLQIGAGRDPAYVYGPRFPRRVFFGLEISY